MDEFQLYEEIKKAFTPKKGTILLIEITSTNISELKDEVFKTVSDCEQKISTLIESNQSYAVFDYLRTDQIIFLFQGNTIMKVQNVETGEILDFTYINKSKTTAEDVRRDLVNLGIILRSTKAL